jgi:hypothetical protein
VNREDEAGRTAFVEDGVSILQSVTPATRSAIRIPRSGAA